MTPRLWQILAGAGLALGLLAVVVFGIDSCHRKQGAQAEVQANIASGEAHAHQTTAQASDKVVADLQAKLDGQAAQLGRLQAERLELLRRLASQPKPHPDPAGPVAPPADPVDDVRDAVIAKDAEVIAAQAYFIEGQKTEIAALVISRDQWKATAEARERQALAQQVATESWKQAVSSSKWTGRVQGFAIGLAAGYVTGRLK